MTPEERLIRYAKINTVSDPESTTVPSSACQLDLLKVLKEEMEQLGIQEVREDQGYLYGRIPSNLDYEVPTVGFIAHMDTAPDFCGEGVNPRIDAYAAEIRRRRQSADHSSVRRQGYRAERQNYAEGQRFSEYGAIYGTGSDRHRRQYTVGGR